MDYLVYVENLGVPKVNYPYKHISRSVKKERGIAIIPGSLLIGNSGYLINYLMQFEKHEDGYAINNRELLIRIKKHLHNHYSDIAMDIEKRVLEENGKPAHVMDLVDKYTMAPKLEMVIQRAIHNDSAVIIKRIDS